VSCGKRMSWLEVTACGNLKRMPDISITDALLICNLQYRYADHLQNPLSLVIVCISQSQTHLRSRIRAFENLKGEVQLNFTLSIPLYLAFIFTYGQPFFYTILYI
jgi:hypothetical protein